MDAAAFHARFEDRAVLLGELPVGPAHTLTEDVNRTGQAELSALFDLLGQWAGLQAIEDHLEREFTPHQVDARMRRSAGPPLWPKGVQSAYLDSSTPDDSPFTGRQSSNHEVDVAAEVQPVLARRESHVEDIVHDVRRQCASRGKRLAELRAAGSTSGTGGPTCSAVLESPAPR